jgi:hypothetical protein
MGSESAQQIHATPLDVLAEVATSVSPVTKTRFGRISKPPTRYEPIEKVEDDYSEEDYDTEDPEDVSEEIETDSDDEESDADENGNLDGFVVSDKSEESDYNTDGESSVFDEEPIRTPVKKRPTSS